MRISSKLKTEFHITINNQTKLVATQQHKSWLALKMRSSSNCGIIRVYYGFAQIQILPELKIKLLSFAK